MLEDLDGLLETISFAFGEVGTYLIEPESSAECVEQQSSGESAHTKQVQHGEDPSEPFKNHGCEPNRRPYQVGDSLFCALFCFCYGRRNRRRLICGFPSAGGVNTQGCIHVGGPVSSFPVETNHSIHD